MSITKRKRPFPKLHPSAYGPKPTVKDESKEVTEEDYTKEWLGEDSTPKEPISIGEFFNKLERMEKAPWTKAPFATEKGMREKFLIEPQGKSEEYIEHLKGYGIHPEPKHFTAVPQEDLDNLHSSLPAEEVETPKPEVVEKKKKTSKPRVPKNKDTNPSVEDLELEYLLVGEEEKESPPEE